MKKRDVKRRLALQRETLLGLSPISPAAIAGGLTAVGCWGTVPSETACGTSAVCASGGCPGATFGCDTTTTNEH
jgi:hypothetical protein